MKIVKPHRKADKALALVMPVIRGLLAEPSGDEDDPYLRVILALRPGAPARNAPRGGRPPLEIDPAAGDLASDEFHAALQQAVASYKKRCGAPPARISLQGLGSLQVEKVADAARRSLHNKVAVVTGAAGAIGAGICKALLAGGCHVAATDIVQDNLDDLVHELKAKGAGRIIGVRMDVTDPDSVAEGFAHVVRTWGGVDLVVVNAGIAMVAALVDLNPKAFRRLETVNVEGTLHTLAEAGRCLRRQRTGGDIVLISTKNVFAPGAQFGAYSATKAASHQLARIASLEFAAFGVRVNMVAPDAVFSEGKRKSGLWTEVGPSRMKARGLDEQGLEEYYRNRNLLKARITATHVSNAVLFFATRQTPTTGATIPVDGGLPDATPR